MEKQEFFEKMEKVAKLINLKMEKYEERYDNFCLLVGEDDIKIAVSNYPKQKLIVSGCYPYPKSKKEPLWTHKEEIEIVISIDKTPEQIAKDIQKRFMNTYLQNLKTIKERNKEYGKYIQNKKDNVKKIADYFKFNLSEDSFYCYTNMESVYKIESYNDKEVKFDVRTTPEKAIRILEILKED